MIDTSIDNQGPMSGEGASKLLSQGDRVGRYEVIEHIASGGMGTVYKARDTHLPRTVALKLLPPGLAKQPKVLDRFRREARVAAQLNHENIVTIYECGEENGVFFLAMEFIPGVDLQDYIEKRRKLPPEEARQIILQAAKALVSLHEQQIVHRDVKPSNFLLTRQDGRLIVKLTDLGLAIQPSDEEFRITREGTTVGTIDYMSPEQARDSGSADVRSDIYSLGCTFYQILTGTAPFAQGTMAERLLQHLQDDVPDARKLNKDVPPAYMTILQRMLAKNPGLRYQTPQELLRDLEDPDGIGQRQGQPPVARAASAGPGVVVARMAQAAPRDNEPAEKPPAEKPQPLAKTPRRFRDPPEPRQFRDPPDSRQVVRDPPESRREVRDPPENDASDRWTQRSGRQRGVRGGVPAWVFFAGIGAGVVTVAVVAMAVALRDDVGGKKNAGPPSKPPPVVVVPDSDAGKKDPPPKNTVYGTKVGPDRPVLATLFPPLSSVDAPILRREAYGPHEAFPTPPAGAPVLVVSRGATPGPATVRSLAEALTRAPAGTSVIEIHDRGPIFVGNLPPVEGRDIFLRAGPGFRPLLAWEPTLPLGKARTAAAMLSHRRGSLVVEGVDIVAKWGDVQADAPANLCQVTDGSLHMRDCTLSLTGKHPHGMVLARLQGSPGAPGADTSRLRLTHCYARGTELLAVAIEGCSADVLLEDSLLVGNHRPLLSIANRDIDDVKLRIVRSTLVSAQNLLSVQEISGKGGAPRLDTLVWDSILARDDPAAAEGDMIRLGGGAGAERMQWRAVSSLYAGWKRLLGGNASIDGGDLGSWHAQWRYDQGDRALLETWPAIPQAQLEELPAAAFFPYDTPVACTASSGAGPVGVSVGRLPAEPVDWLKRTYDRLTLSIPALPDTGAPAIETTSDGLYHGERIELAPRADLSLVVAKLVQGKPLAPRVVFHIAGSGDHPCSPLRLAGIAELVFWFEPAKDAKAEPLTLTVDPKGVLDRPALIELDRGSLELIGAHIRCDNSKSAIVPPHLIKVAGGNLMLYRCQLQGPLGKSPDAFRSLIALAGPADAPLKCRFSDCVLLSGKGIVHAAGAAVQLSARQNVVLALGDALQLDLAGVPESAQTFCQLDNNTWAIRRALVALKAGPYLTERADQAVVHATANYFADPFGEQPAQSVLLRVPEPLLARAQVVWQGKGNAFDRRLEGYFTIVGRAAAEKQALADWLQLWGRDGEPDALLVEPGPAAKATVSSDAPQLERLALPREVRPEIGNPMPGADLARLGLLKKKG